MQSRLYSLALATLTAFVFTSCSDSGTGTVAEAIYKGHLANAENRLIPIAGARATLMGTGKQAISNVSGDFDLRSQPGEYEMEIYTPQLGYAYQLVTLVSDKADKVETLLSRIVFDGQVSFFPFNHNLIDRQAGKQSTNFASIDYGADRFSAQNSALVVGPTSFVEAAMNGNFTFTAASNLTVAAWVKLTGTGLGDAAIVSAFENGKPGFGLFGSGNDVVAKLNTQSGTGINTATLSAPVLGDQRWHHVVMTVHRASNTMKLYVDGELSKTLSVGGGSLIPPAGKLRIGKPLSGDDGFKGMIDDARVYTSELTAKDIKDMFIFGGFK